MKVGLVVFLLGFGGCSYEFIKWDNGNNAIGNASFWLGLVGLAIIVTGIIFGRKAQKEVEEKK